MATLTLKADKLLHWESKENWNTACSRKYNEYIYIDICALKFFFFSYRYIINIEKQLQIVRCVTSSAFEPTKVMWWIRVSRTR